MTQESHEATREKSRGNLGPILTSSYGVLRARVAIADPFLTKIMGPAGNDIRILELCTLPDGIDGRIPNRPANEPFVMVLALLLRYTRGAEHLTSLGELITDYAP